MYLGYEAALLGCTLAAFALACRAVAQACFARRADGVTARMALFWAAMCVVLAVVVPSLDGFAGSARAAAVSAALLVLAAFLAWWLGRHWREQAMQREAERFAAARYYELEAEGSGETVGTLFGQGAASDVRIGMEPSDYEALCARAARTFDLTRREEDVLLLLIQGKSAADVAAELVVSPNTVKTHIRNLYRKLGINRREDLSRRLDCTKNNDFRTFCGNL